VTGSTATVIAGGSGTAADFTASGAGGTGSTSTALREIFKSSCRYLSTRVVTVLGIFRPDTSS